VHSVKFHLDKLVAAGLLEVEYRRLTGRTGPGAGRPSKLYRRSARDVALSVPPRRYDLAGEVLAEAVDRAVRDGEPVSTTVERVARGMGRKLAADTEGDTEGDTEDGDGDRKLDLTARVLRRHGYEPRVEDRSCASPTAPSTDWPPTTPNSCAD
jgi:predicted ArsR family transcriptional regulator